MRNNDSQAIFENSLDKGFNKDGSSMAGICSQESSKVFFYFYYFLFKNYNIIYTFKATFIVEDTINITPENVSLNKGLVIIPRSITPQINQIKKGVVQSLKNINKENLPFKAVDVKLHVHHHYHHHHHLYLNKYSLEKPDNLNKIVDIIHTSLNENKEVDTNVKTKLKDIKNKLK